LEHQTIFIEDWPYAGMDFRRDLDMQLPTREQWDDGGKTLDHIIFYILFFMIFFRFFHVYVLMMNSICPNDELYGIVDVGQVRPVGLAPEVRRDAQGIIALAWAPPANDMVETVARNLEGLIAGIPDYMGIEEFPISF